MDRVGSDDLRYNFEIIIMLCPSNLQIVFRQSVFPSTAKYYTHYSNTVLFLLIVGLEVTLHRHPASSLQWRSLKTSPLLLLRLLRAQQPEPACCCSPVWLLAASLRSRVRCFGCTMRICAHIFFIGSHKGAGTLLEGRALWPLRLHSSPRILPSTAVTCGCYLWSGHYLCFTALNPRQQHPTPNTPPHPSLIYTSSQFYLLSLLRIDGSIQATSTYSSIV